MNTAISAQPVSHVLQESGSTTDTKVEQSTSWSGRGLTTNKVASCWLILAPLSDRVKSHFQKIIAAETDVLYLTDHRLKFYFKSVSELPEYITGDTILHDYYKCKAGSCVGDIASRYKQKSGQIYFGQVDLPRVYSFPWGAANRFDFEPVFRYLKSEFSEPYIMCFSPDDFYWETNSLNAFTSEGEFLISLILPNYEVDSRGNQAEIINHSKVLTPDRNHPVAGRYSYIEMQKKELTQAQ